MNDTEGNNAKVQEAETVNEQPHHQRHLFKPFRMYPDVRDDLRDEFWKRESFFKVIMDNINALPRLKEIIRHALEFNGNVAVNFVGEPRIGKSTVARWASQEVYKIQFKTLKGWKDRLLFARSYSRATEQLSLITKRFVDEGLDDVAVLEQLKGYCLIEDENQLEHEKDSVKAKDDMTNISESCASSGIHFFYLSPKRRGFGYCTILVVGIDPKRRLNLSFYLDNKGTFRGYLITPEVLPVEEYTTQKNRTVVQTLLDRGRVAAKVKEMDKENKTGEPTQIQVPPDAEFIEVLELFARSHLSTLKRTPSVIDRWIFRYFKGNTHKEIADIEGKIRADSVGRSIRELDRIITRTMKGDILEDALCAYLNERWRASSNNMPLPATNHTSSQDFPGWWRRGWRGCDVACPGVVVVNAKLKLEHRPSWSLECLPEVEVLPGQAWVVLCELGPPQPRIRCFPATQPTVNTGSCEEVEWRRWLDSLSEAWVKAVARGIQITQQSLYSA